MDKKICLDTDVCIELVKGNIAVKSFLETFQDYEVLITSITVFELFLRETNLEEIHEFLSYSTILEFNSETAIVASKIFKYLKKSGNLIDFRDLFIAAICIQNNCRFVTFNKKHFERINDLTVMGLVK